LAGHPEYGIMSFSLAGCLIAFFIFNVFGRKNKIFMGDTGSLILGVIMVVLVIKFNEFNINQLAPFAIRNAPAVSIGILIVPVIDTLRVIFIRISEGRSPIAPDMNHIHHVFLKLGNSHLRSTIFIVLINILFIGFSFYFSSELSLNNQLISVLVLGFMVACVPGLLLMRKVANSPVLKIQVSEKKEFAPLRLFSFAEMVTAQHRQDEHLDFNAKKPGIPKETVNSAV
jgi:hypothetical protein